MTQTPAPCQPGPPWTTFGGSTFAARSHVAFAVARTLPKCLRTGRHWTCLQRPTTFCRADVLRMARQAPRAPRGRLGLAWCGDSAGPAAARGRQQPCVCGRRAAGAEAQAASRRRWRSRATAGRGNLRGVSLPKSESLLGTWVSTGSSAPARRGPGVMASGRNSSRSRSSSSSRSGSRSSRSSRLVSQATEPIPPVNAPMAAPTMRRAVPDMQQGKC